MEIVAKLATDIEIDIKLDNLNKENFIYCIYDVVEVSHSNTVFPTTEERPHNMRFFSCNGRNITHALETMGLQNILVKYVRRWGILNWVTKKEEV